MSKPTLSYALGSAGWATAIWNDGSPVEITVSYLHDSLKDLATSVISLQSKRVATVLFMDEPGEHMLVLEMTGEEISYQLRRFDDWASWGHVPADRFKVVAKGTMSFDHYKEQISLILRHIHDSVGVEKYKELWIEHEFPMSEFKIVCGAA